jgi:tetratricopeptide (TPR) repeat protein
MKKLASCLLCASLALASGGLRADTPGTAEPAESAAAGLPDVALTPKLLYLLLLGEIAGQRGLFDDAAEIYLSLAQETRDPRIARRATEIALHNRRPDLALAGAKLWVEVEKSNPANARQTLIGLLAAQGRFDELTAEVAALLAAEPPEAGPTLLRLGRLFARSSDRLAVRKLVQALTEPYLHLPEAHFARAQAAFEARDLAAAQEAIRRARELKPDWEAAALFAAQLTENSAAALADLGAFVRAYPAAREARLTYARALVADKRYQEARREFGVLLEQADAAEEKSGDVIFAVAMLSLQLNDTQEAERQLRRLVEIGHAEADKARYYLGQLVEENRRPGEAIVWYGQVGRGEHYLTARLRAATLMAKQGELAAARRYLAASEAANPRERTQLLIGEAQLLREADQLEAAHALLVAGLAKQPDQIDLLYEIALLAERLGRPDELETLLRRLIALKPDHAHAHNALGYSFADRNIRLDEARQLIDRAIELAPNDPFILDSKGWVLFRQGNASAALEALQQAFGMRADPEIAAHLGEVLWTLGQQSAARATWEKARQAHPANAVLADTIKRFLP